MERNIIRTYKTEEIKAMNYILEKNDSNTVFTQFESEAMSKINLFNKKEIEWAKIIYKNRNNDEELEKILRILNNKEVAV